MDLLKGTNLSVRFLLELVALGALGYWGYQTGPGTIGRITLAIGAPLAAAAIWALFIAPKAPRQASGAALLLLQFAVFGLAVAALVSTGHDLTAALFGTIAVVNAALLAAWNQ